MSELFLYFLKANLSLVIVLLCYKYGIKKSKNYCFGRIFLLSGIGVSFLIPLFQVSSFYLTTEELLFQKNLNEIIVGTSNSIGQSSFNLINYVLSVYKVGAIFFFLLLSRELIQLTRLYFVSQKNNNILLTDHSNAVFSFFHLIFIGTDIPINKRALLIRHEQVHANQFHSFDILLCRLIEIIIWYNPFFFLFKHYLSEMHEFEADEKCCSNKKEYLELMLQQNFNQFNLKIIHQFNSTHLKSRIMRLQEPSTRKINTSAIIISAVLLFSLTLFNKRGFSQEATVNKTTSSVKKSDNKQQTVDKAAEFPGGQDEFFKYLGENITYPEGAKKEGRSGTVYLHFVVDKDGSLKDYEVLKKIDTDLKIAAIQAFKKMPQWKPAEKDGKKVAFSIVVPVKFDLPSEKEE